MLHYIATKKKDTQNKILHNSSLISICFLKDNKSSSWKLFG